jgi:hypothetical protein
MYQWEFTSKTSSEMTNFVNICTRWTWHSEYLFNFAVIQFLWNIIGGVMDSMFSSSAYVHVFESWSGKTKDYLLLLY